MLKHMCACCRYTRKRFERTHGSVLNLHTGRREGEGWWGFSPLSFSPLFLFSLPALGVSLSSLSNNDNDNSSSRALSVHTRLWLARESECLYFGTFPVWPNLFVSYNCASLVPLGMKWAALCWKWVMCLCFVVFDCVWLSEHVLVCDSMCCLRCVVGCRRCVGCCVVVTVQKRPKRRL